mgnify:CR=1 FL=1
MTIHATTMHGTTHAIRADWRMPRCPVESLDGDTWRCIGRTVADCEKRPSEAMLHVLVRSVILAGREPEEFDAEISAAVDGMESA